jgi:hypothetical protein
VKSEDRKKLASQKATFVPYYIGLDSLFQKTPIIAHEKRTIQPEDAFEDADFKPWYEIVKF